MYVKYGEGVTYGDMQSYNRLVNLEREITEQVRHLNSNVKSISTSAIKDTFSFNYYYTGYALETSVGIKMGFGLLNPKVVEASILNQLDRIKWSKRETGHSAKYIQQIKEEITQGLIQGKGYVKVAREIKNKTDLTAFRVDRIVQTETHRVQTQGFNAAVEKTNVAADRLNMKIFKVWVATLDLKTRDTHRHLDGQKADDEGLFHSKGLTAEGPGLFGVAEEDINCRCNSRTEIEGLSPTKRKDNISKELIIYKNYSEWFENRIK